MTRVALLATIALAFGANAEPSSVTPCPSVFETLPLPNSAQLCRTFSSSTEKAGRSISFHVKASPQSMIEYYQEQSLEIHSSVNQRTLMTAQQDTLRVAISADNQGSQIDILAL